MTATRTEAGDSARRRAAPPLELLVFVAGIASLGAEIAAARLIAPFFGASTIVWANTIAIVLVALSIGYWFGGRLADRHPDAARAVPLVLLASVLLALVPLVARPVPVAVASRRSTRCRSARSPGRCSACSRSSPCRCSCWARSRRGRSG